MSDLPDVAGTPTLVRSTYMLRFRLSDVLDEHLETLGRSVIFPTSGMSEGGKCAGSFVDGLLHLSIFGLAPMHWGFSYSGARVNNTYHNSGCIARPTAY